MQAFTRLVALLALLLSRKQVVAVPAGVAAPFDRAPTESGGGTGLFSALYLASASMV